MVSEVESAHPVVVEITLSASEPFRGILITTKFFQSKHSPGINTQIKIFLKVIVIPTDTSHGEWILPDQDPAAKSNFKKVMDGDKTCGITHMG